MKPFKLFLAVLVIIISIFLARASHLSAAETFWDEFNGEPALKMGSHFAKIWRNEVRTGIGDAAEFNMFKISDLANYVQRDWNWDQNRGQDLFPDILLYETLYTIPDEPLTQRMNFGASTLDGKMLPHSNPADSMVPSYDSDYIKSMRIPAPASLVLVAIGLISLRYTKRLRY